MPNLNRPMSGKEALFMPYSGDSCPIKCVYILCKHLRSYCKQGFWGWAIMHYHKKINPQDCCHTYPYC